MKVVKRKAGSTERQILTGMVVSAPVLAQVAPKWDRKRGLFAGDELNTVGHWCVDYWDRYGKAPGKLIQGIYESWAADTKDDTKAGLVGSILDSLSGEYARLAKELNADYLIDAAADHFTRVRLGRLRDVIESELDAGKPGRAVKFVNDFGAVELGGTAGVDVLRDGAVLLSAFENRAEPVIEFKGALGKFFGDDLSRDCFLSFEAPEKRGKTWMLLELSWQAMLQGRRVAFFEVGDLSQNQMMIRFATRAARRPFKATDPDDPIRYPTYLSRSPGEHGKLELEFEERHFKKDLSLKTAKGALRKIAGKSDECLLKLYTYPNYSVSVRGIMGVLDECVRRDWVPDVVVIDYADILAPPNPQSPDSRDQTNVSWMLQRQISQKYHCLMLTASQTKATSYDAETIDMTHFTEDKRKRAHVTATVGINQNDQEKKDGVYRLNFFNRREHKFDRKKCVYLASCLSVANPAVLSTF